MRFSVMVLPFIFVSFSPMIIHLLLSCIHLLACDPMLLVRSFMFDIKCFCPFIFPGQRIFLPNQKPCFCFFSNVFHYQYECVYIYIVCLYIYILYVYVYIYIYMYVYKIYMSIYIYIETIN